MHAVQTARLRASIFIFCVCFIGARYSDAAPDCTNKECRMISAEGTGNPLVVRAYSAQDCNICSSGLNECLKIPTLKPNCNPIANTTYNQLKCTAGCALSCTGNSLQEATFTMSGAILSSPQANVCQ
jgi:hypothetical protein